MEETDHAEGVRAFKGDLKEWGRRPDPQKINWLKIALLGTTMIVPIAYLTSLELTWKIPEHYQQPLILVGRMYREKEDVS